MHGWLHKRHSLIYTLSLKPKILLAPARPSWAWLEQHWPRAGICRHDSTVQYRWISPYRRGAACYHAVKCENSKVCGASALWVPTQGDKFCSHTLAMKVQRHLPQTPQREGCYLNFPKGVSVRGRWSYYSSYWNFEDLILLTHLINKWLSAVERGLLN